VEKFSTISFSQAGSVTPIATGQQYWVKNSAIVASENPPTGNNWGRVDEFWIRITQNTNTTLIYTSANANRVSIADIVAAGGQMQGGVQNNNGNLQTIWGGSTTGYYVSPYDHQIRAMPVSDGNEGWSNAGTIRIQNLWVNIDSLTQTDDGNSTNNNIRSAAGASNPGTGWLRVTGTYNPSSSTMYTAVANQHHRTEARIDTQTPNTEIRYAVGNVSTAPVGDSFKGDRNGAPWFNGTHARPSYTTAMPAATALPTTANSSTSTFVLEGNNRLGPTADTNRDGYLYGIRAQARKTVNGTTYNETAYEFAARSVVQYTNFNATNNVGTLRSQARNMGETLQLWLRGGDNVSGANSTAGFPLSWDETDYSGIRLLTNMGATSSSVDGNGTWYWITWDVTADAFFHFIAGTTFNTSTISGAINDVVNNGAKRWAWAKNKWVFQYRQFVLYPGGSLTFASDTNAANQATTNNSEFYDSFGGDRP
jgi:hypothetical protein